MGSYECVAWVVDLYELCKENVMSERMKIVKMVLDESCSSCWMLFVGIMSVMCGLWWYMMVLWM